MSTTSIRPTKKQRELLSYIEQFIGEHGYSPSYREIMNGLQYTSVATVSLHVTNLIRRGHLRKRDRSARSLEVVHGNAEKPVIVQAIQPNQETWLVDRVERMFADQEAANRPTPESLKQLRIVTATLEILGLAAAADSFQVRLKDLEAKAAA